MSARHYLVIDALERNERNIKSLLSLMAVVISDCELHKVALERDPAFTLLAAHFAFVTGTDIPNRTKYSRLIQLCEREIDNDSDAIRSPENVN